MPTSVLSVAFMEESSLNQHSIKSWNLSKNLIQTNSSVFVILSVKIPNNILQIQGRRPLFSITIPLQHLMKSNAK